MNILNPKYISNKEVNSELFGGNILATRDQLGEDGTYDEVAADLGIESIRYPGGSLTEHYFDLANPDNDLVTDINSGKPIDFLPYSEFMSYAEDTGKSVTIVLPTQKYLSHQIDGNGDHYAQIDEDTLRGFVQDTLDGIYGSPSIRAFEIGNEYWGSGQMSSVEYGRVSSRMAEIVNDEISHHSAADSAFSETEIVVQMGENYNFANMNKDYAHYDSADEKIAALNKDYDLDLDRSILTPGGKISWPQLANKLIINEFDTESEQNAIDGVVAHIYSTAPDNLNSRYFDLNTINKTWTEEFDDLSTYVTEWNLRSNTDALDKTEDYGLKQAHELINMVEAMTENDVDVAHIWAVQHSSAANLSGDEGVTELRIPGEMFRMMGKSLPGTKVVDLGHRFTSETEASDTQMDVHAFKGDDKLVAYIASTTDHSSSQNVDFSKLLGETGKVTITRLGAAEGQNPGFHQTAPEVSSIDPSDVLDGSTLTVELAPYEIIEVVFDDPEFSSELTTMTLTGLPIVHIAETEADDSEQQVNDGALEDDGGAGGLAGVLAMLPMLLLF